MLLPLAQEGEGGGRVLALLDQMSYFAEELDADQDELDHARGQEEGTLVCAVRKVVYADGEWSRSDRQPGEECVGPPAR